MTKFKIVTARAFFREPYKYLSNLPIVVTVRGMKRYVVSKYEPKSEVSPPASTKTSQVMTSNDSERRLCKHFRIKALCKECVSKK